MKVKKRGLQSELDKHRLRSFSGNRRRKVNTLVNRNKGLSAGSLTNKKHACIITSEVSLIEF